MIPYLHSLLYQILTKVRYKKCFAIVCIFASLFHKQISGIGFGSNCDLLFMLYPETRMKKVRKKSHYVNVSVLIKFSEKISVFTLIIISSP